MKKLLAGAALLLSLQTGMDTVTGKNANGSTNRNNGKSKTRHFPCSSLRKATTGVSHIMDLP